jgi:ribonuclease HI
VALIHENPYENDVFISTEGSVVRHVQSSTVFTAQVSGQTVQKDSRSFQRTTSSLTLKVMAVTKGLSWFETQAFTNVCNHIESVSMLKKLEADWRC